MDIRPGTGKLLGFLTLILLVISLFPSLPDPQAAQPTTVYDFINQAAGASWKSSAGVLPFPGADTDNRGFALLRQAAKLEDGGNFPLVLETHPQWADNGWITGTYAQVSIPAGSSLYVRVGFLDGAQGSDGVSFIVRVIGSGMNPLQVISLPDIYDGKLKETTISLAGYAGKTVNFELQVTAGKSSNQDWAAWVDARILQQVLDTDQDGIPDIQDNCPAVPNTDQANQDYDNLGDACDPCDDRDNDGDGIKNCLDQCPDQAETYNNYLDQDGCPDSGEATIEPTPLVDMSGNFFAGITAGPIMPGAFEDNDLDGVPNFMDDCSNTPLDQSAYVFENGCLCQDTDGGSGHTSRLTSGSVSVRFEGGEASCTDRCNPDGTLTECACSPLFEQGLVTSANAYAETVTHCESLGSLPLGFTWTCSHNRCIPSSPATPQFCFSSAGTCADGIQNQDETGVDCGGICPPCNTSCTTGTIYAPSDTPCTSIYPTDMHAIELYWTSSWLEKPCQSYEICHPDLDYIIQEATRCCSIPFHRSGLTSEESALALETDLNAMLDPGLCQAARDMTGSSTGCSRCVGLYIIKGLGDYARWMQGYNWLYPAHNVEGVGANPAERLINDYQTGVCRDYSLAVATLLRKAGYPQTSVNNFCDGAHCYDVVKMPGDVAWHVVDTTGNNVGIVLGSLPGVYPYCAKLDESSFCFNGSRPDGAPCDGSETRIVDLPTICQPGVDCGRDLFSTPGWAPNIADIIGCR
jgi:hypothetical protein